MREGGHRYPFLRFGLGAVARMSDRQEAPCAPYGPRRNGEKIKVEDRPGTARRDGEYQANEIGMEYMR